MSNKHRTVLYTGITGNIKSRVWQHETKKIKGFTQKYNCIDLIYYEQYDDVNQAIYREKQIKKYSKKKKMNLIQNSNPDFKRLNEIIYSINEEHL